MKRVVEISSDTSTTRRPSLKFLAPYQRLILDKVSLILDNLIGPLMVVRSMGDSLRPLGVFTLSLSSVQSRKTRLPVGGTLRVTQFGRSPLSFDLRINEPDDFTTTWSRRYSIPRSEACMPVREFPSCQVSPVPPHYTSQSHNLHSLVRSMCGLEPQGGRPYS